MILRFLAAAAATCLAIAPACANDAPASRRALEAEVLAEINFARQHPREYAAELRKYRTYFNGGMLDLPGNNYSIETNEGVEAVDEAIDYLERQAPLGALSAGDVLALAAFDHAEAQGAIGGTGHVSTDGASPGERVRRRGGDIYVGEGIYYGPRQAVEVVRSLIIDDGVPDRGHRELLFTADFRFAGIGCSEHREYEHMCVVDLAATENGAPEIPAWAKARGAQLFRMPDTRSQMAMSAK